MTPAPRYPVSPSDQYPCRTATPPVSSRKLTVPSSDNRVSPVAFVVRCPAPDKGSLRTVHRGRRPARELRHGRRRAPRLPSGTRCRSSRRPVSRRPCPRVTSELARPEGAIGPSEDVNTTIDCRGRGTRNNLPRRVKSSRQRDEHTREARLNQSLPDSCRRTRGELEPQCLQHWSPRGESNS